MNRIMTISFSEFSIDPDGCAAMLNDACRHHSRRQVSGVAVEPDRLVVALEPTSVVPPRYNFAPIDADSADGLDAEISARYYAGFSLICGFRLREQRWALYAFVENDQKP